MNLIQEQPAVPAGGEEKKCCCCGKCGGKGEGALLKKSDISVSSDSKASEESDDSE